MPDPSIGRYYRVQHDLAPRRALEGARRAFADDGDDPHRWRARGGLHRRALLSLHDRISYHRPINSMQQYDKVAEGFLIQLQLSFYNFGLST